MDNVVKELGEQSQGKSYHHSQSPAGSWPAQTAGDSDPFPGLLECSNRSQDSEWSRKWLSCTVGGEQPQKAQFHSLPHPQRGQIPALSPPRRSQEGWGRAGESGPSARHPQSPPAQSAADPPRPQALPGVVCKTLSKCVSGAVSHCLCCGFPIWETGMMLICPCGVCGIRGGSVTSGINTISNLKPVSSSPNSRAWAGLAALREPSPLLLLLPGKANPAPWSALLQPPQGRSPFPLSVCPS